MEFLRHHFWVAASLLLLLVGCSSSFHKFPEPGLSGPGFWQFRGDPGGNAVLTLSGELPDSLLFEKRLNGGIGAQIVGNDQVVIVPTFNKRIYFLAAENGRVVSTLKTNSAVGAAVAVADELIYFAEQSGGDRVVCFNLVSGKEVWSRDLFDPQGAPVLSEEDLFVSSREGRVLRLNRWTGDVIWEHEVQAQVYTTPAVDADYVYFGDASGELACLDRESGEPVWSFATGGAIMATPMVADLLFCGSSDGTMYAFKKNSGELVWTLETAGQIFTTPALTGGRLLFGSHDRSLYCVDVFTGSLLWSYDSGAIIESSPIALDGHFLCANAAGKIFFLSLSGELINTLQIRAGITAPLALINNRLYIGTESRRIYCFGSSQ
jgi:outer membrane protein assembly factor BamB